MRHSSSLSGHHLQEAFSARSRAVSPWQIVSCTRNPALTLLTHRAKSLSCLARAVFAHPVSMTARCRRRHRGAGSGRQPLRPARLHRRGVASRPRPSRSPSSTTRRPPAPLARTTPRSATRSPRGRRPSWRRWACRRPLRTALACHIATPSQCSFAACCVTQLEPSIAVFLDTVALVLSSRPTRVARAPCQTRQASREQWPCCILVWWHTYAKGGSTPM